MHVHQEFRVRRQGQRQNVVMQEDVLRARLEALSFQANDFSRNTAESMALLQQRAAVIDQERAKLEADKASFAVRQEGQMLRHIQGTVLPSVTTR